MRSKPGQTPMLSAALVGLAAAILFQIALSANHPVLVEGNCPGPASRTIVAPNTCGDYDGDGLIGTAEDVDAPDRVFGTLNAALGPGAGAAAGTGANQNGRVTIVTSGIFPEIVTITAANGNVILEGAPGVEATIDAVLQGDLTPPGNAGRQAAPGIIVNAPSDRFVVIRNITVRNWASGIEVQGDSRVSIDHSRFDSNVNFGISVTGNARATITNTEVHGTGHRVGAGNFPTGNPPTPGTGIDFADDSKGTVVSTTVSHSFAAGISGRGVCVDHVNAFDNDPNLSHVKKNCKSGGNDNDDD